MSDTGSGRIVIVSGGGSPVIEPDAQCEGCGVRGTVGRAERAYGEVNEEHRFCADCWPEWSAFYRARWEDQIRKARDARDPARPAASGMWFESATWHGVIEFVKKMTIQARYFRDPPSPEAMARLAADIRARASEKVGPMPIEVRAFLREFGGDSERS